jgi:hypothetical protein
MNQFYLPVRNCCSETSLEGAGPWAKQSMRGLSLRSRFTRKKKGKEKRKQVTCKFNITGAKLFFVLKSVFLFLLWDYNEINRLYFKMLYVTFFNSWALKVSLCVKYFIHFNVDEWDLPKPGAATPLTLP